MQPRITLSKLWTRLLAFVNFSRPGDFAGCGCVHSTPCRENSFNGSRRRGIPANRREASVPAGAHMQARGRDTGLQHSSNPSPGAKPGSCLGLASHDETAGKSGRVKKQNLLSALAESFFDGRQRSAFPTLDLAGGVLTMLVMVVMVAVCLVGCQSTALQDIDRDYVGTYNATTGQGGVKVRWTPAATKGQGKPAVGLEIDFKQVVPPMDFTEARR